MVSFIKAVENMEEFIDRLILSGKDPYYPEIPEKERITDSDIPKVINFEDLTKVTLKDPLSNISKTCNIGDEFEEWIVDEIIEFSGKPVVVLERNFEKYGLFVYVSEEGIIARIRKSIGKVCSKQISYDIKYPKEYFEKLSESKEDILAKRVLEVLGEPSYNSVINLLPPIANPYHFLRINKEPYRLIVKWDGSILGCFDRSPTLGYHPCIPLPPMHEDKALEIKRGLLGYLPAIDYGYYDEENRMGWEEIAFTYEDEDFNSHLWIRIRMYKEGKIERETFTLLVYQHTNK